VSPTATDRLPSSGPPTAESVESYLSIGRGTLLLVLGTLVLFAASFASRVLIAQEFTLGDWGVFNLGLAVTGLLSVVSLFGLDQAAARSLSYERDPATRRSIVRYSVAAAAAAAAIATTALFALAGPLAALFRAPSLAPVLELFSFAVGFQLLGLILAALFQGCEDAGPNALFNQMVNPVLFVVFVSLAVVFHGGFEAVIVGYVAAAGLSVGALGVYAFRRLPGRIPPVAGPLPSAPRLWPLAISFWGVGSLAFATAFVDTLVLGLVRPAETVGIYSAAMVLGRVLLVGNGALTYIYLPVAARFARERNGTMLRATYLTGTRWSLLIVTPFVLLFTFLPRASLGEVFGTAFAAGALPLQLLAVAAFLSVLVGPANACLAGLGETRALLGTTVASAAINLGLSVGLSPAFGAVGAAIAWGVARVAYPTLGLVVLNRRYGISPFQPAVLRPLALTFAITIPLFLALAVRGVPPWAVFPLAGVGVAVPLLALVVTRSLLPGDLAVVHGLERLLDRPLPGLRAFLEQRMSRAPRPAASGG
jgi:O-antigen/teichoic acid export membrane protein